MKHVATRTLALVALALTLAAPLAHAQTSAPPARPSDSPPPEAPPTPPPPADPRRFFDAVAVSATLNPAAIKDTPGTVSVIPAGTIQRQLMENLADLIRFEPGVYVEANLMGTGLNGINIRGIGGNRVMTMVDGVETAEQFDFGPFNVHQFGLDLDTLKSAEIVRSAGSSLYGSDALGGVVSYFTKDPRDYLGLRRFHIGARALFDGRSQSSNGNVVIAGGGTRVQTSLFLSHAAGGEFRNRGTVRTETPTRTAPNPQDRRTSQALWKLSAATSPGNLLRATVEIADNAVNTLAYSSRTTTVAGPTTTRVTDIGSDDTMQRRRVSLDQSRVNSLGLTQWSWNLYMQTSDTGQVVDEVRVSTGPSPTLTVNRSGTLDYEQRTFGAALQGRKAYSSSGRVMFTFGGTHKNNRFDMIRDRVDVNASTGAIVPPTLILPTKYFPLSTVRETGGYLQAELRFGRLNLVPGVRVDRFSLDADESDAVFAATLSPPPADFVASAVSSRIGAAVQVTPAITLHGQFAQGFRAPPYSSVNSGFTNLTGGYTSLPNPDLREETSDNVEFGVRASAGRVNVGVTGFINAYDGFIQQIGRGMNPTTRLLEFQYQNVTTALIRGVEVQGDASLSRTLRLRLSYALIRGDDTSASVNIPLNTIAPDQIVVGLLYTAPSNGWGSDLNVRGVTAQSQARAGSGLFAPDAFATADAFGWVALGRDITLRLGVTNLTNARYFEWANVRGRTATDPVIDRFLSPGTSAIVSFGYRW
jgi:hemoglobin/transferrin/lactoferrin receptor protein